MANGEGESLSPSPLRLLSLCCCCGFLPLPSLPRETSDARFLGFQAVEIPHLYLLRGKHGNHLLDAEGGISFEGGDDIV